MLMRAHPLSHSGGGASGLRSGRESMLFDVESFDSTGIISLPSSTSLLLFIEIILFKNFINLIDRIIEFNKMASNSETEHSEHFVIQQQITKVCLLN